MHDKYNPHDQPLSALQKSALECAFEHGGSATLSQVRDYYYGLGCTERELASAQACISRARRRLIKLYYIHDKRGVFVLSDKGRELALKLTAPIPIVAGPSNDRELTALIAAMRRPCERRHMYGARISGRRRRRIPPL